MKQLMAASLAVLMGTTAVSAEELGAIFNRALEAVNAQKARKPLSVSPVDHNPVLDAIEKEYTTLAEKVSPGVVMIVFDSGLRAKSGPPGRGPFGLPAPRDPKEAPPGAPQLPPGHGGPGGPGGPEGPERGGGSGSGVIIHKIDGKPVILTNSHVVGDAKPGDKATIFYKDRTEVKATVLGSYNQEDIDLALMMADQRCDACPVIPMGDYQPKVGQFVVAFGAPLGLDQTATYGQISAVKRSPVGGVVYDYVQNDASINPGNSGGPLFDMHGRVIAINTLIYAPPLPPGFQGGSVGLGFSIPIRHGKAMLERYLKVGRVSRARIGVSLKKLVVEQVSPGSPAAGKLQPGDQIIAADGKPLNPEDGELSVIVSYKAPGESVHLTIVRNGSKMNVTLVPVD